MAVKERKQITGTTAQINTYKGHEGQIVWDKDKKTFVGMSGTAGKNYPLAPKEYVDNEVVKVNTELQKTNAEVATKQPKGDYATNAKVTECLAGKEDKGVCLPLTGGVMTGDIVYDAPHGEFAIETANSSKGLGARIAINTEDREGYQGQVILQARSVEATNDLILKPVDGGCTLAGKIVDCIQEHTDLLIKYHSGIQICIFSAPIMVKPLVTHMWSLTFPTPFVPGRHLSVAVTPVGHWAFSMSCHPENVTSTGCSGTLRYTEGSEQTVHIQCIAIGHWK